MLKIGHGFERLFFFMIFAFMAIHIIACLWVFFASLEPEYKGTWMDNKVSGKLINAMSDKD